MSTSPTTNYFSSTSLTSKAHPFQRALLAFPPLSYEKRINIHKYTAFRLYI